MAGADLEMIRSAAAQQAGRGLGENHEGGTHSTGLDFGAERLLDELIGRSSDLVSTLETLCDSLADAYFSERYPGFDLDDPDWPLLNLQLREVTNLLATVQGRTSGKTT